MYASAIVAFGLIMTLTFDLWPCKPSFSAVPTSDKYLWQVSLKSLN